MNDEDGPWEAWVLNITWMGLQISFLPTWLFFMSHFSGYADVSTRTLWWHMSFGTCLAWRTLGETRAAASVSLRSASGLVGRLFPLVSDMFPFASNCLKKWEDPQWIVVSKGSFRQGNSPKLTFADADDKPNWTLWIFHVDKIVGFN